MALAKQQIDVLVVGAGPVGLTAALRLAALDARVQIVDEHWRTGAHSYALALHPASLDLLDDMGVLSDLLPHGRRVDSVVFYEGVDRRCEVSLAGFGGARHGYVLVLPQSRLEGTLEAKLRTAGVDVLWNHRLQDLRVEASGIAAGIARLDRVATGYPIAQMEWVVSKNFEVRPACLVGADGYRSLVREKMGIELKRLSPTQTFHVFEVKSDTSPGNDVHVVLDAVGVSVLWPMKDNRCRWSFQVNGKSAGKLDLAALNALIRTRAPWFPIQGDLLWSSPVTFAPHLADAYGRDGVWLAGDALHMAGPIGVQSMNAGLLEGDDLARRIGAVLHDKTLRAGLDEYGSRWGKAWRALLNLDGGLDSSSAVSPWVKREASRILSCMPATGPALEHLLGQLGLKLDTGIYGPSA